MPVTRKSQYDTHFYCALCGGPFAQVVRTPVSPASPKYYTDPEVDQNTPEFNDPADLDPCNEFNFVGEENRVIPEEVVEQSMGYAARRSRKMRLRAEDKGRRKSVMSERRVVREAYDGRRISVKQLKWTKNLRALVHSSAKNLPHNWQQYTTGEAFLTGRGLMRQCDNWADAFASVEEDENDDDDDHHPEYPVFSEAARANNTYGLHVYQELGGEHLKNTISSIPFHDECWSLLDLAIEVTGQEKGLECMNECLDIDHMWNYLRSLITISGERKQVEQTSVILQAGRLRKDVATRLGEVDYREAQGSGEGWHWRHEDGCHWLAADPSLISVRDNPLKLLPNNDPLPCAPRAATMDPFMSLPPEVILEISSYISASDVFCLKTASPAVLHVALPDSYYRRFLREEFKHLPKLNAEIEMHEKTIRQGIPSPIDWRGSFERLRCLIRTPRLSGSHEDGGYGKEWDEVDIGLKNRNRIWKIVKPIAETLVETSSVAIQTLLGAHESAGEKTGVVRGYVGVRSMAGGAVHTAYVGCRGRPRIGGNGGDKEELVDVKVWGMHLWYDKKTGIFCGLEFDVYDEELGEDKRRFGRRGSERVDVPLEGKVLAGFAFCFDDGIVCGAQAFFVDEVDSESSTDFQFSRRVGKWLGFVRKVIVPLSWRKFVGLTGFINSTGFIETVGVLEETAVPPETVGVLEETAVPPDNPGRGNPPPTIPLSHDQASLWRKKLPPNNVAMHEREGADVADWRISGSEWEIWEPGYSEDGVEFNPGPDRWKPSLGRLESITSYYDHHFLRGLEFKYRDLLGHETCSLIGLKKGYRKSRFSLSEGESVIASVINSGDEGVYGILFLTQNGKKSEVFGPRLLGTHKVFAPPPDMNSLQCVTEHQENIPTKIIGLHGLYDYEEKRFLQLGLILQLPPDGGCSIQSIFTQPLPRSIPFYKKDDSLGVWDDGPPPNGWIIGANPADLEIDTAYRARRCRPFNDYCGWAKLEFISKITVYRDMKGIKFDYAGGNSVSFGCVDDGVDAIVHRINYRNGERVVGVAVLGGEGRFEAIEDNDGEISILSASTQPKDDYAPMERLHFITNHQVEIPSAVRRRTRSPDYLVGIKFDFNHDRLVSWAPLFFASPSVPGGLSHKELTKSVRFPWRAQAQQIVEDCDIPETAHVVSAMFGENEAGQIDAVKGYVTRAGQFSGLLFRRNGKWSQDAFGERSAYEITFELEEGEAFVSVFLPVVDGKRKSTALALSTNRNRTTPWVGTIQKGAIARQVGTPPGHIGVGIFGQFSKPDLYGRYEFDLLGLLCCHRPAAVVMSPTPQPRAIPYHIPDLDTGLRWLNDLTSWAGEISLTPLLQKQRHLQRRVLYSSRDPIVFGRAFSVFEPEKLLQIRVWCSQGICSIRLRGTEEMGTITVGDWPADAEGVSLSSDKKMLINGPGGERICSIKVAFQMLRPHEDRIVGLCFTTTFGRKKTVLGPMASEAPFCPGKGAKILECRDGYEVVGLHGIFGVFDIHDLGLVVRKMGPLCHTDGNRNCAQSSPSSEHPLEECQLKSSVGV